MDQSSDEAVFPEKQVSIIQLETLSKRLKNKKFLLIVGVILFFLIVIPIFALLSSSKKSTTTTNQQSPSVTPTQHTGDFKKPVQPTPGPKQASQTLIYGTWTSQTSVIRAVDTATATTATIATLPLTVKKVSVLSNTLLIYIDQTDSNDYGQRLSIYNIKQNQIVTNIPADSGFGIDDYVLSPDKKYLVYWEVKLSPDTQTLQGGKSRVYAVNLAQPSIQNLLYDEMATPTIPIHYPRAILDDGTVLTDEMIPNDPNGGAGWAYGMSVVNFDKSNKQDIAAMTNGTYGSQPTLSSDGKYLLFAGYDGLNGSGTATKNGYRQALLTPNTVELLDTRTFQRFKLPNLPNTNTYSDVQWDTETGNVILSILSADTKQMGIYSYDVGKLKSTQLPIPSTNGNAYGYISQLSNTRTLIGIQSTDSSNVGNLGATYTNAYTQIATLDDKGSVTQLSTQDPFMQYITILPQDYFKNVLGAQTKALDVEQSPTPDQGQDTSNLQLNTFFLKSNLASTRLQIESSPLGSSSLTCLDLGGTRCTTLGFTPQVSSYATCVAVEKVNAITANACY